MDGNGGSILVSLHGKSETLNAVSSAKKIELESTYGEGSLRPMLVVCDQFHCTKAIGQLWFDKR